jgi:hypothetical protein
MARTAQANLRTCSDNKRFAETSGSRQASSGLLGDEPWKEVGSNLTIHTLETPEDNHLTLGDDDVAEELAALPRARIPMNVWSSPVAKTPTVQNLPLSACALTWIR